MFDNLSLKLDRAFKTLKGTGKITEINVATTVKEIRRALIDADVNYKVAKEVTDTIKTEALGRDVLISVSPGQLLVKITQEELTKLMGGTKTDIKLSGEPAVVLISGLQGSGKTTFTGKLGSYLKKQGRQVLLVACDIYRPAAIDQLKVLGEQIGVEVYAEPENKNALEIANNAIAYAKKSGKKTVIVDTAGRLAVDEQMMNEIEALKNALKPSETLFVVDSMTGQDAVNTAKTFDERLDFDGVVLTKLDGDTRGGAAISIRHVVNKPIKFISTGEKMENLDVFHPDRMAQRILGMGDVISLVERAQQSFDEDEAKRINAKIRQNNFNFDDFLSQLEQVKKMGNIKDLMGMIPGMGKAMKGLDIDDDSFKPIEAIIRSMTPLERENPDVIDGSRRKRIADGSGRSITEVNNLMKQFADMRKLMKQMNKMGGAKAAMSRMMPGMGRR
ncbi:MAG TPA: signal recognition particle protein [Algoriphagus sp.]|jgi:signal recognition particle subunit SRP54|uniref:signal recognition particle protein n=1 Tax=unclassified Algoriphagus TaxID=2641541 RepID=UPI000C52E346|nr:MULTISPECIES: signal recognition particle protein [unclassified Algoriphagus]MAL12607.1 signal recognition particle protein [Algoriphagus sp.]HAD50043.1 signal recognition particle protein [Algoriphagus sp.]HAS57786.1 signal recognition particle protein [Algoriphagus sp.]HCD86907.1 signal recognition particle protein [Algoriphagus sp.]HCH44881.1 signal recognition particle protein [Algoriphagus sp.]|tara:strand:+ start:5194 stop:6531 length:1338 start_codon:yes stop_codon:yes gene_type:complete